MTPDELRIAGFLDPRSALGFFEELPGGAEVWAADLGASADPDQALLAAIRLHEADPGLVRGLVDDSRARARLCAVLGGSQWLGDYVIADPARARAIWEDPGEASRVMLASVGATRGESGAFVASEDARVDDLRGAYRRVLLYLAADDLTSDDPEGLMPEVGLRIADLVDATLEAGLALARRDIDPQGLIPFAIIAMGKTGARELNYISDVDVVYVAEAGADGDERVALEVATRLAAATASACSGPGTEAPLWTVDANLRPEGRNGALVRTVESYRQYWDKWAQTWEFQALLKAAPARETRPSGVPSRKPRSPTCGVQRRAKDSSRRRERCGVASKTTSRVRMRRVNLSSGAAVCETSSSPSSCFSLFMVAQTPSCA